MKKFINKIISLMPKIFMRNIILMESVPDYSDNTKAVFDELIRRKINEKIKIVWLVTDINKFRNIKIKNVKFISYKERLKLKYYSSLYLMDSNRYLKKINKHQMRIHLRHGESLKLARDYCKQCGDVDYTIELSSFFTDKTSELYMISKDKILPFGFPRNDVIINNKPLKLFPKIKRSKTILWMPTYRNHKTSVQSEYATGINFLYGVPCINNSSELKKVNDLLQKKDILLIIKLHPAENKNNILKENLSNICLLDNDYFTDEENIYNYLSGVDAVITDYSSIYYDFLLTNNMIGLAIPDIDEYKKHVELMFDDYKGNVPGEIIMNNNDLCEFINHVNDNKDLYKKERMIKRKQYHEYLDGNASKRVVDFFLDIIKKGK